jgi:hypothetical protein
MIPALAAAGFFLAIIAALQFSSWAEGWLASKPQPIRVRESNATSTAAPDFSEPTSIGDVVHAA